MSNRAYILLAGILSAVLLVVSWRLLRARKLQRRAVELIRGDTEKAKLFDQALQILHALYGQPQRKVDALEAPPKYAKYVLLLVPKKFRESLLGDFEEEYNTVLLPEYGPTMARWWYRWQVIVTLLPMLWARLLKVAGVAALFKLISR